MRISDWSSDVCSSDLMFPQFVNFRADNVAVQFALLAGTGITVDIIVLSTYAGVAARGGRLMATGPPAVWRERISGAALVIVGSALSLVKRTEIGRAHV